MTSKANGKPQPKGKRLPWIPPRFDTVTADLVGYGHTYFDNDDTSTTGSGRSIDTDASDLGSGGVDQANPWNS